MKHFKNEDKKPFIECSDEEKLCIIDAKVGGAAQFYFHGSWCDTGRQFMEFSETYRVMTKPMTKPMTIDEFMKRAGIVELGLEGSTFEALFEELFTDIQERGVE